MSSSRSSARLSSPRLPSPRASGRLSSPRLRIPETEDAEPEPEAFPRWFVWGVLFVSVLPLTIGLLGGDFGLAEAGDRVRVGTAIHALLEWTSFSIAAFTVVLAISHYSVKFDVSTPIIGAALSFSGLMDAFITTAILGLTARVADPVDFVPFTWMLSRTYNACILIAGAVPFLVDRWSAERAIERVGRRYLVTGSAVFALMTFAIVSICARIPGLPTTTFPGAIVPRPWDIAPLVGYIVAMGVVLPRFHAMYPSLFTHGLVISMLPCVASECHAAFGSSGLYDHHFFAALLLKIVAYLVPLCGLIVDSSRAHESDVAFSITREKLKFARSLQQSLLPQKVPVVAGIEFAGKSKPIEAVGGDYFDYLTDDEDRIGIVVADVSGHELAASIVLAQTRAYLRALAAMHERFGPMLTKLNQFLHEDLGNRWFVTLFFARIDPATRKLNFVAAGHMGWLVRGATVTTLDATCPPLGILDGDVKASDDDFELVAGDILLVVSDGVLEALSPSGEPFGTERATNIVRQHAHEPASEIVDAVFDGLTRFQGIVPQSDDVTVVVMRVVA